MMLITLSLCGGCALIPLSTLGSLASLGNSSVTEGRDAFFFGKLKSAEMASFDQARRAVRAAANDFGLKPKWPEKLTPHRSEMAFIDTTGAQIGIRIDEQSTRLVHLRLDVGLFGSEPTERVFLMRVRAYLPDPASRPAGKTQ
jgi:hypothetical protein